MINFLLITAPVYLSLLMIGVLQYNHRRQTLNQTIKHEKEMMAELKKAENKKWISTLTITEEASRDKHGKLTTIFYIKEKPFDLGRSYQSTALTEDAAKWVISQLKKDFSQ